MKCWILLLTLFLTSIASAKTLKVAVIDTGLDLKDPRFAGHLCHKGHKDFTGEGIKDINDHGTFVAGLIQEYAKDAKYCLLIYKYYQQYAPNFVNGEHERAAIKKAVLDGAEIINFSGGGEGFNEEEALFIKYNPQVTFVVAAGNEGKDLDIPDNEYYPASLFYGNIEAVENIDENGIKAPSSNYSKKIENKEVGVNVHGLYANGLTGWMSGTSMSTAIHTGKLIKETFDATK